MSQSDHLSREWYGEGSERDRTKGKVGNDLGIWRFGDNLEIKGRNKHFLPLYHPCHFDRFLISIMTQSLPPSVSNFTPPHLYHHAQVPAASIRRLIYHNRLSRLPVSNQIPYYKTYLNPGLRTNSPPAPCSTISS